ncbi:glycosyltransferase family 2 protein [soil metagenome]
MSSATTGTRSVAPSVTAVYVSWRDTELLLESIAHLAASSPGAEEAPPDRSPALSLVVVVNEARGSEAEQIERTWPGATVIANQANRGFGPAANLGAAAAPGEVLLFLNPDTRAVSDLASEVVRAFRESPSAVAVAPRLEDADGGRGEGQHEFQLRRLPTLAADARDLLLVDRLLPGNRWRRRDRYLDADRERPFPVEQAAAAGLAVRRSAFQAVGGFDERFVPAWWEDVDLCLRLRKAGDILFWPSARLEHIGGVSADALGEAGFLRAYYQNALRYRAKHYGMPVSVAYRALLVVGMLLRAVASLVPSARRGRLRDSVDGYVSVIRLALNPGAADGAG